MTETPLFSIQKIAKEQKFIKKMKAIICDRCKAVIGNGHIRSLELRCLEPLTYAERQKNTLDFCERCFDTFINFENEAALNNLKK